MIPISPKKHRKRLRISVDTTHSLLPEYPIVVQEDSPPGYASASSSAEHADEESDSDHPIPLPPLPPSSSRKFKRPSHRKAASSDVSLDTLLARSVQALELSNTLLKTSMNTTSSLSTIFSPDSPAERSLEARAHGLSSRIRDNRDIHESWKSHLEEISRDVEHLFDENSSNRRSSRTSPTSAHSQDSSLSSSLPPSSTLPPRLLQHRRMNSLEFRNMKSPQLRLAPQDRDRLVSPPPRAMTQYIATTTDPESIVIPSTIGLRSASHSYRASSPASVNSSLVSRDPAGKELSVYTKLYAHLSHRSPAASSSNTPKQSPISSRNSSISCHPPLDIHPDDLPHSNPLSRSRSRTPKVLGSQRQMTPPQEESSGSSDDCRAKLTVQSLRKILDVQPAPAPKLPPTPAFTISPSRVQPASASNATASVSRLFTKPTYTSTTRPRSPTRSSLKSTTPSPSQLNIPETFGASIQSLGGTSNPSSGRSTPKRISFAELPESYASTRPEGVKMPSKRRKHRKKNSSDGSDIEGLGWLTRWLLGPMPSRPGEREDWRGWTASTRPMGGMEDWGV